MSTDISDIFSQLVGRTIPGGCDHCDAEQTIRAEPDHPGVWRMTVAHDDWCPWLAARRARSR